MLSGQRAFERDTGVETMTAILKEDPPDLPSAERHIPPALVRIVERCLEKSPVDSISDGDRSGVCVGECSGTIVNERRSAGRSRRPPCAQTILACRSRCCARSGRRNRRQRLGDVGRPLECLTGSRRFVSRSICRLESALAAGSLSVLSRCPRTVACSRIPPVAGRTRGCPFARLDQLDDRRIDGTEGAHTPFFSPDGQWIGFFTADGKLKKMSVNGGTIATICDAVNGNRSDVGGRRHHHLRADVTAAGSSGSQPPVGLRSPGRRPIGRRRSRAMRGRRCSPTATR